MRTVYGLLYASHCAISKEMSYSDSDHCGSTISKRELRICRLDVTLT
jgi:hypothetical protein